MAFQTASADRRWLHSAAPHSGHNGFSSNIHLEGRLCTQDGHQDRRRQWMADERRRPAECGALELDGERRRLDAEKESIEVEIVRLDSEKKRFDSLQVMSKWYHCQCVCHNLNY